MTDTQQVVPETEAGNRRTARRLDKVFAVHITGPWGTTFGIARNISEGGMFIEAPDPYPLGARMEVTFSLPGGEVEMTALAEVVHQCFLSRTAGGGARRTVVGLGVRFLEFMDAPLLAPVRALPGLAQ